MNNKQEDIFLEIYFSLVLLLVYLVGLTVLSIISGTGFLNVSLSSFILESKPLWTKFLAFVSIASGTALIYFMPGISISRLIFPKDSDVIIIFAKGFLINFFFFFTFSFIYKLMFGLIFSREIMLFLVVIFIFISFSILFIKRNSSISSCNIRIQIAKDKVFFFWYSLMILLIFFLFKEKIFYPGFFDETEGLKHFYAAYSLRNEILPTFYNEKFTLHAGFSFSPGIYINMFALNLFGIDGFVIRLQIVTAFIWMGIVLKYIIDLIMNKAKLVANYEYFPLLLYLFLYFIIISYRAGYDPPTDLAKSAETVLLAIFFTAFYILLKDDNRFMIAAILFSFASMVRFNAIPVTILMLVLFKFWKCLLLYCIFWVLAIIGLHILLIFIPGEFGFIDMLYFLKADMLSSQVHNQQFSFIFTLGYLRNYFIMTAGLSIFLILGIRNKYVRIFAITTVLYLLMPLKSIYLPAHYFAPIFFFPIIGFYLWKK